MTETCEGTHPENDAVRCTKSPHPFGSHYCFDTGQVWPGVDPPARRTTKGKGPSRPEQIVDSIEASGNGVKTGAPSLHLVPPMTGEELRDDAIRRSDANTPEEFRKEARAVLHQIALTSTELTAEDVMDRLTTSTHDNRAMGAIMLWGVKQGWIAKTSPEKFVQSRYPRRHKMDVRVWGSLIHNKT